MMAKDKKGAKKIMENLFFAPFQLLAIQYPGSEGTCMQLLHQALSFSNLHIFKFSNYSAVA